MFFRGAALDELLCLTQILDLRCVVMHWLGASNDPSSAKNHFVSFLPSKIPMEFWNFGILFCKSLISLKKVDSNFTLRKIGIDFLQ